MARLGRQSDPPAPRESMTETHFRKIRSFVRRPGRMTAAQQRALERLFPKYGLEFAAENLDLDRTFGRSAPRVLDIGFGDGEALVTSAVNNPDVDYLGVEVHEPGIGHLLVLAERTGAGNVRVVNRDVVDVIAQMLGERSFAAVNLFFPDPWPKKRHHKRRLLQPTFVADVERLLEPEGLFHVATDWADYADHAREVLARSPAFAASSAEEARADRLAFRPPTKFERRGLRLGHEVVDLYYRKRG
jgi:tRNA (guanine-N7-)-methyltransferase